MKIILRWRKEWRQQWRLRRRVRWFCRQKPSLTWWRRQSRMLKRKDERLILTGQREFGCLCVRARVRPSVLFCCLQHCCRAWELLLRVVPIFDRNGGWIFDNFPQTLEQWNVLIERSTHLPDDVIILKDSSDSGDDLIKRWYQCNRNEVDEKIRLRLEAEEAERQRQLEEKRWGKIESKQSVQTNPSW